MLGVFVLVATPALMAAGAYSDLSRFRIPNWVSLALMAVFAAAAVMSGATWSVIGAHALTGFVALAIGIALFALGLIGGGDAKFFAAISLWMGSDLILKYCLLFAMIGGGFALLVVVLRRVPLPAFTARISMINHLIQPKAGLPYGVALGAAGLLLLTSVPLFQMAVSS